MSEKPKVIVIIGPTAVGKTALSVEMASRLNGELISGDSMQVYKGLDIGTAKIKKEETRGIPHYLLDVCEPTESFTAADFQRLGREAIKEIHMKGKLPIVVGGTGLYIEALLYELPLGTTPSPQSGALREELEKKAEREGKQSLWEELHEVDPLAAEAIHPNNLRRVIRALEVYLSTGELFSSQKQAPKESPYDFLIIGLETDRQLLYERIDTRVKQMVAEGLEEEARRVWLSVSTEGQAAKGIGYKEFVPYFKGNDSLEDVVVAIQKHSRNYAKRQLTWFRNRMDHVRWFDLVQHPEQFTLAIEHVKAFLEKDH